VIFASRFFWPHSDFVFAVRDLVWAGFEKTDQGVLRFTHFLALAYLCYAAAGEGGRRLAGSGAWGATVGVVRKVGQQSLPIFLTGMVAAQAAGALLDVTGRDPLPLALVNLAGFALLIAVAYLVAWFKSQPWRRPPQPREEKPATDAGVLSPARA
jgi:hypothetical protein